MFHVEHSVDASMYVLNYAYNRSQVKPQKRVKRHGKIMRLEAAAWFRAVKRQVSLRLDADVLAWFRRGGRGYQTRINRALREVMREESNSDEKRRGSSSRKARDLRRPTRSTLVSTMASTT